MTILNFVDGPKLRISCRNINLALVSLALFLVVATFYQLSSNQEGIQSKYSMAFDSLPSMPEVNSHQPNPYTASNPRTCAGAFCSIRYIPQADQQLSIMARQSQWDLVSAEYNMTIVYQNAKAQGASRAFVTMITGTNIDYIYSSFVLANSIREQSSLYPTILLMNHGAIEFFEMNENLKLNKSIYSLFDMIISVPTLQGRVPLNFWEKIFAFSLVLFDRCAWLGSDTVLAQNVDHMLDCAPPCGIYDEHLWTLDAVGAIVNGDVFVFKPNLQDFVNLFYIAMPENLGAADDSNAFFYSPLPPYSWYGPFDQGMLNTYYCRHITVLPKFYHFELGGPPNQKSAEKDLYLPGVTKLVHFAANSKPWLSDSVAKIEVWCPNAYFIWKEYGLDNNTYSCSDSHPLVRHKVPLLQDSS